MRILVTIVLLALATATYAKVGKGSHGTSTGPGQVYVRGYTKQDGTYVQGYWRDRPRGGGTGAGEAGGETIHGGSNVEGGEPGRMSVGAYPAQGGDIDAKPKIACVYKGVMTDEEIDACRHH